MKRTAELTIYHNPRCSKSRATLRLLREQGISPRVIEYLKTPPDAATLRYLLELLGMKPHDLLRTNEDIYRELDVAGKDLSDAEIIQLMTERPILIERPIVVKGDRAALGRPPENVLALF